MVCILGVVKKNVSCSQFDGSATNKNNPHKTRDTQGKKQKEGMKETQKPYLTQVDLLTFGSSEVMDRGACPIYNLEGEAMSCRGLRPVPVSLRMREQRRIENPQSLDRETRVTQSQNYFQHQGDFIHASVPDLQEYLSLSK